MKEFNRDNLSEARAIIQRHLNEAAKELGVVIKMGSIRFSKTDFRTKLEVMIPNAQPGDNGGLVDSRKISWETNERFLSAIGLKKDDYMRPFTSGGKIFKIVEVNPRRYKRPILAVASNDKDYIFTANQVLVALGRKSMPEFSNRNCGQETPWER